MLRPLLCSYTADDAIADIAGTSVRLLQIQGIRVVIYGPQLLSAKRFS